MEKWEVIAALETLQDRLKALDQDDMYLQVTVDDVTLINGDGDDCGSGLPEAVDPLF